LDANKGTCKCRSDSKALKGNDGCILSGRGELFNKHEIELGDTDNNRISHDTYVYSFDGKPGKMDLEISFGGPNAIHFKGEEIKLASQEAMPDRLVISGSKFDKNSKSFHGELMFAENPISYLLDPAKNKDLKDK